MNSKLSNTQTRLRVATRNCNMAFRNKCERLLSFAPDIAVIQECEKPERWPEIGARSIVWCGDNEHKGLAVVTFGEWKAEHASLSLADLRHFLPLQVTGKIAFQLLGVWAMQTCAVGLAYVAQVREAVSRCGDWLAAAPSLVVGDLNGNAIWDRHRTNNFMSTVSMLEAAGLASAYHRVRAEAFGEESRSTLHLHRNKAKPYHIDYVFVPQPWAERIRRVHVGKYEEWRAYSDHCPVVVDLVL